MRLKKTLLDLIDWGAGLPASPWQLAALFAVTVILRNILEALALGIVFEAPAFLLHFPVAYVYPLLVLVFFMRIFSGCETAKLLRIMVLAWTLTLLPPLIDATAGTSSDIGYFPLERSNAGWFLLNFFNPAVTLTGTTTGIRIEAALGCILAGLFTWTVAPDRKLLRGVLNTLTFAPVFLTFFTWPYLVTILFQPLFPGDGLTHSLLQWHGSTEAPVTGASHYIVYIIDMIPVSLLSLWYVKELARKKWDRFSAKAGELAGPALAALLGTVAAFSVIPSRGLTFADAIVIAGALLTSLWLAAGTAWKGSFRGVATGVALSLAWACGWMTLVLALLAVALSGLPGPERLRRPLFSASLFMVALSPAGFTLASLPAIAVITLIVAATALPEGRKRLPYLLMAPALALAILNPPASVNGAWQRGLQRRTDTFARSGRVALAMESAARLAASGGSWLTLAETTHLAGFEDRSRYVCETAMVRGDSAAGMMKVALNLAFARGDSEGFDLLFREYADIATASEYNSAINMRVTFMAISGDTAGLGAIHARAGMNPMLLGAMSSAYLATGDTLRAMQYRRAFLDTPAAAAKDWALAVTLAAVTGGSDWDSLYSEGERKLGICLPLLLARLRAPLAAGIEPDRRDLLETALLIKPDGAEVLETAAMWFAAAGMPDSALHYGSRAIAGTGRPGAAVFSLVIRSAMRAGELDEAMITARYAAASYPEVLEFRAIHDGLQRGLCGAEGDSLVMLVPGAAALSDSVAALCP